MTLTKHIGKTVKSISPDELGDFAQGLTIEFTDGTILDVETCGCCGMWEVKTLDADR